MAEDKTEAKTFWIRGGVLALISAVLGAAATQLVEWAGSPASEITVLSTELHSQAMDYALSSQDSIPNYQVYQYSIKNTGSRAIQGVTIEFAPAGGDIAYDASHRQQVWVSSLSDTSRTGRLGARLGIQRNVVRVTYDMLRPGETDLINITNDGTAVEYDISLSSPEVSLIETQSTTELPEGRSSVFNLSLMIAVLLGGLVLASYAVLHFRKEQTEDAADA